MSLPAASKQAPRLAYYMRAVMASGLSIVKSLDLRYYCDNLESKHR